MSDNTQLIWIIGLLLFFWLALVAIVECDTEPLFITYQGKMGYFIPEKEFDNVLLMMSDLEWYKTENQILKDTNQALLDDRKRYRIELWISRGTTVLALMLSVTHSILREVGR